MTPEGSGLRLLAGCVSVSAGLHLPLLWPLPVHHSHVQSREAVELDLVASRGRPGPPGPTKAPAAKPVPLEQVPAKPAPAWTLPEPGESPRPAPAQPPVGGDGDADHGHESAEGGSQGGGAGGAVRPPVLLNHGELHDLLRRLYPESERELGRESVVVLSLKIDADGRVSSAEIERSGGRAFDEAARRVAQRLQYAPAISGGRPVSVTLRQAVIFRLER